MPKTITMTLSQSSIQNAIKELRQYQNDLDRKCEIFCQRLAELGIQTAKENTGNFGKYISFTYEVKDRTKGCKAVMVATNTGIIHSEWQTKEGVKSADVSPILMCEFGGGIHHNPVANPKAGELGFGVGTFPGQTHAFEDGWWYPGDDGEWHYTHGVKATMPMYNASTEMLLNILKIAREVFRS